MAKRSQDNMTTQPAPVSKTAFWTGCLMSALPVLMLSFSATMKFLKPPAVVEGFAHLGYSEGLALPLAMLELTCTVLYVIPRTAVLGAILVTGYLGGAIASHVRLGEPFLVQTGLGVLAWGGLFLRDPRLRALIPLRRDASQKPAEDSSESNPSQ